MSAPTLSVLIPAFNRELFLPQAIASVRAQAYAPLELIVVDDGSTDRTAAVARAAGAHVVSTPHRHVGAARNTALDHASGELIAFLDSDDIWLDGTLAPRVARLAARPELKYVLAHVEVRVERERERFVRGDLLGVPKPGLLTTFVGRREAFDEVGRFDERLSVGEDVDWFARATDARVPFERMDLVCAEYRVHDSNTTLMRRHSLGPDLATTLKAMLDRRRAEAGA